MARRNHTPSYRLHKVSGQGIVTLTDAVSGQRKDFLLGTHNSKESRIEYARILSGCKARGRLLDLPALTGLTIAELPLRFMNDAVVFYGLIATHSHRKNRSFALAEFKNVGQRIIDHNKVAGQIG